MHDLRIERALGHDWAYAWCPCGWTTEVEYNPRSDTENDFKRAFHGHLRSAQIDGSEASPESVDRSVPADSGEEHVDGTEE